MNGGLKTYNWNWCNSFYPGKMNVNTVNRSWSSKPIIIEIIEKIWCFAFEWTQNDVLEPFNLEYYYYLNIIWYSKMIQKNKSMVEISIEFIFRHTIRSMCNSVYTHILRVHITCQDDGVVVCTKAHLPLLCYTLTNV